MAANDPAEADGSAIPIRVGVTPSLDFWRRPMLERRDTMEAIGEAGLDHVFFADHVSFHTGAGMDGMVTAAGLLNLHPTLGAYIGVYLLALRHPVTVARQISNLAEMAPGRLSLGIGVGGEDRHEIEVCGVDPRTRGRRTDESLEIVSRLLAGETVDHDGEFFQLEQARITPSPDPVVPVYVGGRSDRAIARAGRSADGWLGIWCDVERYVAALETFDAAAASVGRSPRRDHGIQLWVGVGADPGDARGHVARAMEGFYRIPFEKFERYTPVGNPEQIADFLRPFAEAGCRHFNLTPCAEKAAEGVAAIAEVKRLLS